MSLTNVVHPSLVNNVEIPTDKPLIKLQKALNVLGKNSKIEKIFTLAEKAGHISDETYLGWEDSSHLGGTRYFHGILPEHLTKPVMWGIRPLNQLFITIRCSSHKQHSDDKITEVQTLFLEKPDDGDRILTTLDAMHCIDALDSSNEEEFFNNLTKLFNNQQIMQNGWNETRYYSVY